MTSLLDTWVAMSMHMPGLQHKLNCWKRAWPSCSQLLLGWRSMMVSSAWLAWCEVSCQCEALS